MTALDRVEELEAQVTRLQGYVTREEERAQKAEAALAEPETQPQPKGRPKT